MILSFKKIIVFFFIFILLQSCVLHSHPPFICFSEKCVQNKRDKRHLAAQVRKSRTKKLKSTKGERAKSKVKTKKETPQSTPADPNFVK